MAHVQILCRDPAVLTAIKERHESGTPYGGHLRRNDVSDDELKALDERNKISIVASGQRVLEWPEDDLEPYDDINEPSSLGGTLVPI
jgi:hypothetical protein